jgi:uncharacterized phage protein gp47/JayE
MYEDKTPDAVREQILDNYGGGVNTSEGSFASDMAAPVSLEISKAYGAVDNALSVMAIEDEELTELERRAGEYGITRKPGAKATGILTITGTDGTPIPAGTVAMTEDGLRYTTDAAAAIASGSATVGVTAEAVGAAYNVSVGQITRFYRNLVGITGITNAAALEGGVDDETDAALRARLFARLRTPATSGNVHHYMQWALEVTGVGAAKVTPLWDGPGTVRVLIVGPDRWPVSSGIVDACAAHIEEVRPIRADVTVVSAIAQDITVTATVAVSAATTLSAVQAAFEASLTAYLQSVAFVDYSVSFNRIAYLLMSVEGVIDFTDLQLNGGTVAITIDPDNVPVLAGVTLSAA